MPEGGYFQQTNRSPKSLAIVILLHIAVLTALALSKTEVIPTPWQPIKIKWIEPDKPPPPIPVEKADPQKTNPASTVTRTERVVESSREETLSGEISGPTFPPLGPIGGPGIAEVGPIAADPLPPVRIAARIDPRSALQPPYPASEQRESNEGSVTVRLLIGADGRVKAVEKIRASSEAFWRSTERHAMRAWRFTPATLDGKPVESRFTLTVTFRLES